MPIIDVKGHEEFSKLKKPDDFIILFKAGWNLPSKAMYKIVADSASKNKEFTYYVLDIEDHDFAEEIQEYGALSLPTVVSIRKGQKHGISIGTTTRLQFSIFTGLKG